jgi:hypothetical protein
MLNDFLSPIKYDCAVRLNKYALSIKKKEEF